MVRILCYENQSATPKQNIALNPKRVFQYLKDLEQYSYHQSNQKLYKMPKAFSKHKKYRFLAPYHKYSTLR